MRLIISDQTVVVLTDPPQILFLHTVARNCQGSTASTDLKTVEPENPGQAGLQFFSLSMEAKQHFTLLEYSCETPRPCTMSAIIKPSLVELENKHGGEQKMNACLAHIEAIALEGSVRMTDAVWLYTSSTLDSDPAVQAGGGDSYPS